MNDSYEKDQVIHIINSVIQKVNQSTEVSKETIFQELKELQNIIEDARRSIGATNPAEITDKHIPSATDELDEVVNATAEATGKIMDCCEVIEDRAGDATDEGQDAIVAEVTKIYEACSFQDITGQRITKVIKALRDIEDKVSALVTVIGEGISDDEKQDEGEAGGDEVLLNGPQMASDAITQDEIDKLLAEFD